MTVTGMPRCSTMTLASMAESVDFPTPPFMLATATTIL
jgi:hypothetical protein